MVLESTLFQVFILKGLRIRENGLDRHSSIDVDSKKVRDDRGEKATPFRTIHTVVRWMRDGDSFQRLPPAHD